MNLFPVSFRYSLRVGLLIFLFSIPVIALANSRELEIQFGGFISIATNFVYGATLTGGIAALAGLIYARRHQLQNFSFQNRLVNAFGILSIAFAYAVLTGIITYMGVIFLQQAFQGAKVTTGVLILMAAAIFGVIGYLVTMISSQFSEKSLLKLTITYLLSGLAVAMLAVENPQWWENSLSYMGHDIGSDFFFRTTLLFGGFMAVLLGNLLLRDYRGLLKLGYLSKKTYLFLVYVLNAFGLLIMIIGIFRSTVSPISDMIHNVSGSILAISFVTAAFLLPILIKKLATEFKVISVIVGLTIIVVGIMWAVIGIANFVFFEIVLFGVIAIWVPIFFEATKLLVRESKKAN